MPGKLFTSSKISNSTITGMYDDADDEDDDEDVDVDDLYYAIEEEFFMEKNFSISSF